MKIGNLEIRKWDKDGKSRAYITNTSAVRNKQDIGYINLLTGEIVPGHAQHEGSVCAQLSLNGTSVEAIIAGVQQ